MSNPKQATVDGPTYRYWAFISYSSKDKKWARWLHQSIETYGIPTQLVSHPTPAGPAAPKRFHPLFHDRAELPASADLGAAIEEALRASRYLIVVCSPNAEKSKWVNKEVETFKRFHRHGRILAIIVDGEPNQSGGRECFPPALRSTEPIAADARPEADGKNNAKLKLLAGMLGVTFDALKQREVSRQVQRLQRMIAAALLLVLAFAGLAWYANQQREKAVKARNQAEDVLEFLVYDMRNALENVGHLDLAAKVTQRVEEYYRQLGIESHQPRILHNRSSALNNEGNLAFSRGDLPEALRLYRAALVLWRRQAQADPTDANQHYYISLVNGRIGDVLSAQGDSNGALRAYQETRAILQRLTQASPTNAQWQYDMGLVGGRIGDILNIQGDSVGALLAYQEAQTLLQRLVTEDPSNTSLQFDLGISYERIGVVLQERGDLAGALAEFERRKEIITRLTDRDPFNTSWQRDLSVGLGKIGDVLNARGDSTKALVSYREALGISQRLVVSDPENSVWQRDLFICYVKLATVEERNAGTDPMESWRKAYEQLSNMKQHHMMIPTDEQYLEKLRQKVGR